MFYNTYEDNNIPIVATTVTKEHIRQFGVEFPSGWEIRYLAKNAGDRYVTDLEKEANIVIEGCAGADFLLVNAVYTLQKTVIENIPSVRYIQVEGAAYHRVDFNATIEQGLPLCNTKGANALSVAEFTIAMMIMLQRRLIPTNREIREGNFLKCQTEWRLKGSKELCSAHVGIVGLGDIGKNVARMLAPFNCRRISYYDIVAFNEETEKRLNVHYLPFDELLEECDIITLHLPVTPDTIKMISAKEITRMKNTAILINTARGEVLDQQALADALEERRLYGAGIDVYDPEPPDISNCPLLNLSPLAAERLFLTPHVAGTTDVAYTNMLGQVISNMQNVLNGKSLSCVVNGVTTPRTPYSITK
jgi:D-3-phosphoglycerate dehydrogenase